LGLERKPGQGGDKFVNLTCCWLASKLQQLCDQVPVFGGEPAGVGVWPIDPDGLNGNVCTTFNLYEVESDEGVLAPLDNASGFDAKAVDFWIEHASDLSRGRAEIDVGGHGGGIGWLLTNKRLHFSDS
jgi:hypothetical protein